MTPQNLINTLLGDEPRIVSAITSGIAPKVAAAEAPSTSGAPAE